MSWLELVLTLEETGVCIVRFIAVLYPYPHREMPVGPARHGVFNVANHKGEVKQCKDTLES